MVVAAFSIGGAAMFGYMQSQQMPVSHSESRSEFNLSVLQYSRSP